MLVLGYWINDKLTVSSVLSPIFFPISFICQSMPWVLASFELIPGTTRGMFAGVVVVRFLVWFMELVFFVLK